MRIQALSVSNFRAISSLTLRDLKDTVVIAGPNGCGKSCIFDAIRLLKSAYGGYYPNEWQNWFGEFQISVNRDRNNWLVMLQTLDRSLVVSAEIALSESEIAFVRANASKLLTSQAWKEIAPETAGWNDVAATPLAANLRVHQSEVEEKVSKDMSQLQDGLAQSIHIGRIEIATDGEVTATPSPVLQLLFSQYDPQNLGIIDFHGANRNYNREQIGGINLNIEPTEDRLRQHALYNSINKYQNLKSEMASGYIRQILAEKANNQAEADQSLGATLKELFTTFFPGKEFIGPRPTPDGRLTFPVRTASSAEHDIDDLSSGEKEVLYGYLRLRNAAPRNSVLLIDEPELHLNPRLIRGLASFYHRHLGRAQNNQLWLVTHSDTLIREAVGQSGFSVFHMQPPSVPEAANQASPVLVDEDIERLVIELVGDLAAYRPGGKMVIFEGGSDSEFDIRFTCTLFPRFQAAVNPISGGNKKRVGDLYELLEAARTVGKLPTHFYMITDRDGAALDAAPIHRKYSWDRYHIENYLLDADFILRVLQDLNLAKGKISTENGVHMELMNCANETIPDLVAHELRTYANATFLKCINLNFTPSTGDTSQSLSAALSRSSERIQESLATKLSRTELKAREKQLAAKATEHLQTGEWRSTFRGREVLRRFVGHYGNGIKYEQFRDLIIARMRDAQHEPAGMKNVIDAILKG